MHDGRREKRSVASAMTSSEPGVGESVAAWEGVLGIDAVVRDTGQPQDRHRMAETPRGSG